MSGSKIKVLYVDDEMNNLVSFKATFRLKYDVQLAASADEAKQALAKGPVHVIITDQRMPGITGVEFLESILEQYPEPIRILLTGYADINAVIDAINKGKIFHYLSKPWDPKELEETIERAFDAYQKIKEDKEMNHQLVTANSQLEFLLRQNLLS